MKIIGYDFPDMLIKVSSNREYLEDIASGIVFMNESGYFRRLEDTYRGDKYDGKCPVCLSDLKGQMLELGSENATENDQLKIPIEWISDMIIGFDNDDKIPLFCCSILSENILKKETEFEFAFKEEYVSEMQKFGEFYMLFSLSEFLEYIIDYTNSIGAGVKWGTVTYTDILEAYNVTLLNADDGDYDRFFNKDITYRWQNEWRLLFDSQPPLIGSTDNHFIAKIKPLSWFHIGSINGLKTNRIEIQEDD